MTAKRTTRTTVREVAESPEDEAGEMPDTLAESDSAQGDADLAELGIQLPEGAMGTVYRLVEGGEKEFIDELLIATFSVAGFAARYGGGRYMMYLKKPHPEVVGKWNKAGSKPFRVAGPPRYGGPAGDAAAPSTVGGAAELEKLTRLYGESIQSSVKASIENSQLLQQMQLAVVKSLSESRPTAPSGPTFAEIITLIDKMAGRAQAGTSIADVIALADRMASRTSPTAQLKETIDLIATARDLGGGESGPAWIPLASKALDALAHAVSYNPQQLPAGDAPNHAEVPAIVAPVPAEVSPVPDAAHPLLKWLAPQIPFLIRHAQADHDPDTYAGMICDLIPADQWPAVLAFLQAPDFPAQLQAAFPVMLPVQQWFGELRDMLVARLHDLLASPATDDAGPELVP